MLVSFMTDVAVIGAGPAGSVAAKLLADFGFQVSLYEKEKLPRHKHCAGYVSPKSVRILDSIGIDCRESFEQVVRGMRIRCGREDIEFDYAWSENELPGNVCREHFDHLLAKRASASGTTIIDSTRVTGVAVPESQGGKCQVVTEKGTEGCEIILGADGATSVVRRDLGITYPKRKLAVTLEAEVPVGAKVFDSYAGKNYYDFGFLRSGYGWAFPKRRRGTVNVGVVVSVEDAKAMGKPVLSVWREFLHDLDLYEGQDVHPHGNILPYQGTTDTLGCDRALLLGDAAGFVEPLGGEGIPYAIESGINAANAVKSCLENGGSLLKTYRDSMKDVLDEINVYGMKIHESFFVKKKRMETVFKMAKKNKEMSDLMNSMMSRKMSYKQAMESLSPWKIILPYLRTILSID
jgi:geranylgeranyl reductase family protein